MTIDDIRDAMNRSGSHWWEPSSMRFFGTRAGQQVYEGPGGIYFVTSEQPPRGPRRFTVRHYIPGECRIRTVAPFCGLTRSVAHSRARFLAADKVAAAETEFSS